MLCSKIYWESPSSTFPFSPHFLFLHIPYFSTFPCFSTTNRSLAPFPSSPYLTPYLTPHPHSAQSPCLSMSFSIRIKFAARCLQTIPPQFRAPRATVLRSVPHSYKLLWIAKRIGKRKPTSEVEAYPSWNPKTFLHGERPCFLVGTVPSTLNV